MTNGCQAKSMMTCLVGHPTSRGEYSWFDPLALVRNNSNRNKSDVFLFFKIALSR